MKVHEFRIANVVEILADRTIGTATSALPPGAAGPRFAVSDDGINALDAGDPEGSQRT